MRTEFELVVEPVFRHSTVDYLYLLVYYLKYHIFKFSVL